MKRFRKFTDRHIKSLIVHLKKYGRNHESEMLHQIRLDIKKIKAILTAIKGCRKRFKAHRSFLPFRHIFRKAEEIREPDVLAELLLRYQLESIVFEQKSANKERVVAAFTSDIPHFINVVKHGANGIKPLSKQIHRGDFLQYLSGKKKEVKSQLSQRPTMAAIHKVRKSIKEIVYLSDVGDKLKRREARFYDKMQDIIGSLHDKQVLLDLLKGKTAAAIQSQLDVIKSECVIDKKGITRLASDYYGRASGKKK